MAQYRLVLTSLWIVCVNDRLKFVFVMRFIIKGHKHFFCLVYIFTIVFYYSSIHLTNAGSEFKMRLRITTKPRIALGKYKDMDELPPLPYFSSWALKPFS